MNDVQKVIFNIFLEVSKVLSENNIDYYANGGTCLGAVRHKGFIPWDDDIDITVKIEDYEKTKDILAKELPDYYSIRYFDNNDHYANVFFKVVDERTTCIEKIDYKYKDAYKGCFIDIMPISGMPDRQWERNLFCKKINIFRILSEMRIYGKDVLDLRWKRVVFPLLKPMFQLVPSNYYCKRWLDMLKKYPFEKCNYTGYVWWFDVARLIYKREVFGTPTPIKFEDTAMYCPEKWDVLLKQQFGDYMSLPPKEKQRPMHVGTLDLEHSYHDYASGKYPLHMEK